MRRGRRPIIGRLGIVISLAAIVAGSAVAAGSAPSRPSLAPVEAKVLRQLAQHGNATFWIVFGDRADLSHATAIRDRKARGEFVYRRLTSVAAESQASTRALLKAQGVRFQPFWVVNAIRVVNASPTVLELARSQAGVQEIRATRSYPVPKVRPAAPAAPEWNLDAIHAPEVWSTFGDRGEGIVVASIDTGVRYTHSALLMHYRGRQSNRTSA